MAENRQSSPNDLVTGNVELKVADSGPMRAYIARPASEHQRAVVEALAVQHKQYVNGEFSSVDHAFFCDERSAYEPHAARQSWALTLEFLRS